MEKSCVKIVLWFFLQKDINLGGGYVYNRNKEGRNSYKIG